jgi:spore germination cell wall hydrolase CwlJ-like protein
MVSQLSAVHSARTWKVLIAALFVTLLWQTPTKAQEITVQEDYKNAKFLSIVDIGEKIEYTDRELLCLAKNIYYEAGAEALIGRLAVAQVTLNRTVHPKFKGSICSVVMAPHQFSWTSEKNKRSNIPTGAQWNASLATARQLLDGARIKGMEEALYFHEKRIRPVWKYAEKIAQIGGNIFFKKTDKKG